MDKLDLSRQVKHILNFKVFSFNFQPCIVYDNLEQLNEIRKSSVSRIFCDNSDDLHTIQPQGFLKISEK